MKTVTDLVSFPGITLPEERIVFVGPPSALSGRILIANDTEHSFQIGLVPLVQVKEGKVQKFLADTIQINASFAPGQRHQRRIKLTIDELTPPGVYDTEATIGGINKTIQLVVQSFVHVEIHPSQVHFAGITPGRAHQAEVLFINKGNIPLSIPVVEEEAQMKTDDLSRLLVRVVTQTTSRNPSDFFEALDRNIRQHLSTSVHRSLQESGRIVLPGEGLQLHFTFRLPMDVKETEDYEEEIKLYNQKLLCRIVHAQNDTHTNN